MTKRKRIDWDRIESEYRLGKLTVREMEAKYGVANETIVRHMKKAGITRDLSAQLAAATKAAVISDIVSKASAERQQGVCSDLQIAARVNADVVESHREGLSTLKGVVQSLALELAGATRAAPLLAPEEIVSLAEAKGLEGADLRNLLEAAETSSRAATADRLAAAWAKLVPLERKTHNLDTDESAGKGLGSLLAEMELLRAEQAAASE